MHTSFCEEDWPHSLYRDICCPERPQRVRRGGKTVYGDDAHKRVAHMDPEDVINMGQMPIPYPYHANGHWKGTTTIHVQSSTADTEHATLAETVSASEKLLPPMLIFKGQTNGQIATNELQMFPANCFYVCQPKV